MDVHQRRKITLKVLKIAVGSCMAVAIAQFLDLQYATSAGIVTLLTVQDTRRLFMQDHNLCNLAELTEQAAHTEKSKALLASIKADETRLQALI